MNSDAHAQDCRLLRMIILANTEHEFWDEASGAIKCKSFENRLDLRCRIFAKTHNNLNVFTV